MRVIVIGGTGHAGGAVVEALGARGHQAVPVSRSSGVDVVSGDGVTEALRGADVVVDTVNPDSMEYDPARDFFTAATANLLEAGREAGVGHHVTLSILGIDRVPDLGYYRAKLDQESAVAEQAGPVPYTIVRSAQFFDFVPTVVDAATEGDVARLSPTRLQPIALTDLGRLIAETAVGQPHGGTSEIAGPDPIGLDEMATRLFAARGRQVEVDSSPDHRPFFGAAVPADALLPGPDARLGETTFEQWLRGG